MRHWQLAVMSRMLLHGGSEKLGCCLEQLKGQAPQHAKGSSAVAYRQQKQSGNVVLTPTMQQQQQQHQDEKESARCAGGG